MKQAIKKYLMLSSVLVLSACGAHEQNPIKDYQFAKSYVPERVSISENQQTMSSGVSITADSALTFVQGEEKVVNFRVVLNSRLNPDLVRFNLLADGLPAGASFVRAEKFHWILKWTPATNILNENEDNKTYNVTINFVPDANNPAEVKNEYPAGSIYPSSEVIVLQKSSNRPVILDDITYTPSIIVDAGDEVKIQFTALATGLDKPESLDLNLNGGPDEPSRELVQMDATYGIHKNRSKFRKYLGVDKQTGAQKFLFELTFNSQEFVTELLKKINANSYLKNKYARGEITLVEAAFSISVTNSYSHATSAEKQITLTVNLEKILQEKVQEKDSQKDSNKVEARTEANSKVEAKTDAKPDTSGKSDVKSQAKSKSAKKNNGVAK